MVKKTMVKKKLQQQQQQLITANRVFYNIVYTNHPIKTNSVVALHSSVIQL